jgi:hypothetical protein
MCVSKAFRKECAITRLMEVKNIVSLVLFGVISECLLYDESSFCWAILASYNHCILDGEIA